MLMVLTHTSNALPMPSHFVYLKDIDPTIIESARYYTDYNFTGRPVPGYESPHLVCTRQTAEKLKRVQASLKKKGFKLVVYDAYRPERAVNAFIAWSRDDTEQAGKTLYYPTLNKNEIFPQGYVAEKSGHTRGSTIDLTLIKVGQLLKPITVTSRILSDGSSIPFLDDNTVDMGSSFDLFHPVSHHETKLITDEQKQMRELLYDIMIRNGFVGVNEEWWHYTAKDEPYPNTYFDFVVNEAAELF